MSSKQKTAIILGIVGTIAVISMTAVYIPYQVAANPQEHQPMQTKAVRPSNSMWKNIDKNIKEKTSKEE